MRAFWNHLSIRWCRIFHPRPSWPAHGHYHCPACFRIYPVPWREGDDFLRRSMCGTNPRSRQRQFIVFEFQKNRG
jgi:hypothetical protein